MARGWSDGLPVVPPYRPLVERMLGALGWSAMDEIGQLEKHNLIVRAEQLAATAVMAGCLPEHAPVLRALAEALLDPRFNLCGVAVTTGGASVLVVVSGPVVARLGFAHGANSLASPARANATIGRFASLVRRFCGLAGGVLEEFGTIGHPGRIAFCIAEHPEVRWPPFHTQHGLPASASAVTVMATEGPNSVNNHYADSGEQILETIADCIAHDGSTSYYYRTGGYLVVLAPEHLEFVAARFSREQARRFLFEHAVRSTDDLIRLGRIPRQPAPEKNVEAGRPRSPLRDEAQLTFVETGGPVGRFSAVIPGWVGNNTVVREIASP